MRKRRFFDGPSGLTVAEIVSLTGAELLDATRLAHLITDVAPIDLAGPTDLTFIESNKYADALATTNAGACLMPQRFEGRAPDALIVLRIQQPYRAFVAVHSELYPQSLRPISMFEANDVAPGATVHPTARLESGVTVDPGVVIGPRAEIGAGSIIAATAVIGPDVLIGRDCTIGAGCSIMHALIGDRVVIHPGCRIGQDGFGYVARHKGSANRPRDHPERCRDRRRDHDRPWRRQGHHDRGGHQDRQFMSDRSQRVHRPSLRYRCTVGIERQRDARGFCRAGWRRWARAARHDREGGAGRGALGRYERRSTGTNLGGLSGEAENAMDATAGRTGSSHLIR